MFCDGSGGNGHSNAGGQGLRWVIFELHNLMAPFNDDSSGLGI